MHILKNALESEDVSVHVFDENIVALNPLFNVAVGGVKLKVNEKDLVQAQYILASIDEKPYSDEQEKIIQCPNCVSTELYSHFVSMKSPMGWIAAITTFLFSVFPMYCKSVYRCKKCDTEFKFK